MAIKKVPEFPIIIVENFYKFTNKETLIDSLFQQQYKRKSTDFEWATYLIEVTNLWKNFYLDFVKYSRLILNPFEIVDENDIKVWCYFSTQNRYGSVWHNHFERSTIVGVYYLSNPSSIQFRYNGKQIEHIPNENDMIIFPDFLEHRPLKPINENPRVSINVEILCKEPSHQLFSKIMM